jgi:hypothetical protein
MNEVPAINEALIRQYVDQHALGDPDGLRNLISIFDFQRRQMQRAEDLCRIAWAEVERLSKLGRTQLQRQTEGYQPTGVGADPRRPPSGGSSTRKPSPPAKAPPTPAVEVNMDDL